MRRLVCNWERALGYFLCGMVWGAVLSRLSPVAAAAVLVVGVLMVAWALVGYGRVE